jgi:hypothetical protein
MRSSNAHYVTHAAASQPVVSMIRSWRLASPHAARVTDELMSWHAERDDSGRPLDGDQRYVVRFDQCQEPPARGFWSIAIFDENGMPVDNRLHRFAIGDRSELTVSPDGALEIAVCHESRVRTSDLNWLPAPATPFFMILTIYGPTADAVDGVWRPPPVRRDGSLMMQAS